MEGFPRQDELRWVLSKTVYEACIPCFHLLFSFCSNSSLHFLWHTWIISQPSFATFLWTNIREQQLGKWWGEPTSQRTCVSYNWQYVKLTYFWLRKLKKKPNVHVGHWQTGRGRVQVTNLLLVKKVAVMFRKITLPCSDIQNLFCAS